jgi:hypothetical protein
MKILVVMVLIWLCHSSMVAQVRAKIRSCGTCGGQGGTGAGFLRVLQFPLPSIPPITPHSSSSIFRGWHNQPAMVSVIVDLVPLGSDHLVNTLWLFLSKLQNFECNPIPLGLLDTRTFQRPQMCSRLIKQSAYSLLLGAKPTSAFSPSCTTRNDWKRLTFSDNAWCGGTKVVAATERLVRDLAFRQWQGWLCNHTKNSTMQHYLVALYQLQQIQRYY